MKKSTIICAVILAVTMITMIVLIVIGINKNKTNNDVVDDITTPVTDVTGSDETTTPAGTTSDVPVIAPDDPDDTTEPEGDGDINLDVVKDNTNGQEDEPGIVGEVVIIPGIKDESEDN